MATEEKKEDLKELVKKVGDDIEQLIKIIEEDKETNRLYLTELIKLLTEDVKLVKLLPIEMEVHNFRRHREGYFQQKDELLDGITENYKKISEYFEKELPQKQKNNV